MGGNLKKIVLLFLILSTYFFLWSTVRADSTDVMFIQWSDESLHTTIWEEYRIYSDITTYDANATYGIRNNGTSSYNSSIYLSSINNTNSITNITVAILSQDGVSTKATSTWEGGALPTATQNWTADATTNYVLRIWIEGNSSVSDATIVFRLVSGGIIVSEGATDYDPVARFTFSPSDPEPAENINFNASLSSDPDGSIASYSWDFGDSTTGSTVNVTKSYASAGSYSVNLTVTDDQGATNSFVQTVTVTAEAVSGQGGFTERIMPDFDINILRSPSYVVTTPWESYFTVDGTIHNKGAFQQEVVVEYVMKNEDGEVVWEKTESFLLQARETRPITVDFLIPSHEGVYKLTMRVIDPRRADGSLAQQTFEVKNVPTWLLTDFLFATVTGIVAGIVVLGYVGYKREWFEFD